jgi:DNA polymerase I-like protein with 3'-5' exonuclease and polymerase domains
MVECEAAGLPIQLQVHDELDTSVESPEHAREYAEIMRNCVKLTVPSKVDVEIGPSWGEAVKVNV